MKYTFWMLVVVLSLSACQQDNTFHAPDQVAVLKIDYLTTVFEGATELAFPAQPSFTIVPTYQPPGDFGNLKMHYQEANGKLFDGGIHWMGLGTLHYPTFRGAGNFWASDGAPAQPIFEEVVYGGYSDPNINTAHLWDAIKNLEFIKGYLNSNPNAKIYYFLYTPSVGIGNPADWDWILMLKK
jgi:hypothetical protein